MSAEEALLTEWCWCRIQEEALVAVDGSRLGLSRQELWTNPVFRKAIYGLRHRATLLSRKLSISADDIVHMRKRAHMVEKETLWGAVD